MGSTGIQIECTRGIQIECLPGALNMDYLPSDLLRVLSKFTLTWVHKCYLGRFNHFNQLSAVSSLFENLWEFVMHILDSYPYQTIVDEPRAVKTSSATGLSIPVVRMHSFLTSYKSGLGSKVVILFGALNTSINVYLKYRRETMMYYILVQIEIHLRLFFCPSWAHLCTRWGVGFKII